MQTATKICTTCGMTKLSIDFYKRSLSKDGLSYRCKDCDLKAQRKYRSIGGDKIVSTYRQSKYGVSNEEFKDMLESQDGKCAICKIKLDYTPGTRKHHVGKLNVDHCHDTGKVRGLLCMKCNAGLGLFNDDEATIFRAYEYLQTGKNYAHVH